MCFTSILCSWNILCKENPLLDFCDLFLSVILHDNGLLLSKRFQTVGRSTRLRPGEISKVGHTTWCVSVIQRAPLAFPGLHVPWESLNWPLVHHQIRKPLVVNCLHPE